MDNSKKSANNASRCHAHWIIYCDGYYPVCSNCGKEPPYRTMTDYCPYCGAYMGKGCDEEKKTNKKAISVKPLLLIKHRKSKSNERIPDERNINICLNCTQEKCKRGECGLLIKKRRAFKNENNSTPAF